MTVIEQQSGGAARAEVVCVCVYLPQIQCAEEATVKRPIITRSRPEMKWNLFSKRTHTKLIPHGCRRAIRQIINEHVSLLLFIISRYASSAAAAACAAG